MSEVLFVEYPKCSTCQKAKKWLQSKGIAFTDRDIVKDNPSAAELKAWLEKSGKSLKSFFNTSGLKYKELRLKEKLPSMTQEEQLRILSEDGMLVKRPVLVTEKTVLTGFRETAWAEALADIVSE